MVDLNWQGTGPKFGLDLRSISLSLNLEEADPGLELARCHGKARLLALHGLGQAGRYDPLAFSAQSLAAWDVTRGRLAVTYTPVGWGGLTVRAAWSPMSSGDGVGLEIQASADSAAKLEKVEVGVASQWFQADSGFLPAFTSRVESRDAQSAALSYDGRESGEILSRLTSLPLATSWAAALGALVVAVPGGGGLLHYIEMVQPDDVARRIIDTPADDRTGSQLVLSVRYGLLGHDIEKGVVLRARLRAQWFATANPENTAQALWRQFLKDPLPLGP